jgi:hypothetical protein
MVWRRFGIVSGTQGGGSYPLLESLFPQESGLRRSWAGRKLLTLIIDHQIAIQPLLYFHLTAGIT